MKYMISSNYHLQTIFSRPFAVQVRIDCSQIWDSLEGYLMALIYTKKDRGSRMVQIKGVYGSGRVGLEHYIYIFYVCSSLAQLEI